MPTAWDIGEQSAGKPLGKFGCKVDRANHVTIQPLPRIRVKVAQLSKNFPHASAASPAAHNPDGAFEAGSIGREITP